MRTYTFVIELQPSIVRYVHAKANSEPRARQIAEYGEERGATLKRYNIAKAIKDMKRYSYKQR